MPLIAMETIFDFKIILSYQYRIYLSSQIAQRSCCATSAQSWRPARPVLSATDHTSVTFLAYSYLKSAEISIEADLCEAGSRGTSAITTRSLLPRRSWRKMRQAPVSPYFSPQLSSPLSPNSDKPACTPFTFHFHPPFHVLATRIVLLLSLLMIISSSNDLCLLIHLIILFCLGLNRLLLLTPPPPPPSDRSIKD